LALIAVAPTNEADCTEYSVKVPGGYVLMDPEGIPNVEVEWKAPAGGQYSIIGNFSGIDTYMNPTP
jgi:hypothetical protein